MPLDGAVRRELLFLELLLEERAHDDRRRPGVFEALDRVEVISHRPCPWHEGIRKRDAHVLGGEVHLRSLFRVRVVASGGAEVRDCRELLVNREPSLGVLLRLLHEALEPRRVEPLDHPEA